ncbi:MAG: 16S rRNA (adenine(1518)-N(6)/adenine(1519)-N(6))-dimethyltransferase RsmA [Cyanobacteriota bacterium]|nr:16S rRNA (adenine(1518)-N(6)/adenine(1519)-N(6))-dimethyltransferase RsmA [Cyanobacteriota bacterium]
MPRPRKRFAQHWLRSDKILDRIVAAAQLSDGDRVLEIGPGTGVLTRKLLPGLSSLVSVELDRDLCQKLVKKLGETENFLLLEGDFLALNLPEILASAPEMFREQNKVVANIPYNITGPILEKLLGTIAAPNPTPYESIVLLLQKEVADRLCAKPGSRTFGALSVRVQYLASCELICSVPAKAFYPPPKVESAVVRLYPRSIDIPAESPKLLERLVREGFSSKRKMLRNNLKGSFDRDRIADILEELDMNPQARAEDLGVTEWVKLSNAIGNTIDRFKIC